MDAKTYDELSKKLLVEARALELRKRPAYTVGSEDILFNFKDDAKLAGITARQSLLTHWLKHARAVISALKDPNIPQGEALEGRMADLINYTKLAWALVSEEDDRKIDGVAPTPFYRVTVTGYESEECDICCSTNISKDKCNDCKYPRCEEDSTPKYEGSSGLRRFSTCPNCNARLKTKIMQDGITIDCEECGYHDREWYDKKGAVTKSEWEYGQDDYVLINGIKYIKAE